MSMQFSRELLLSALIFLSPAAVSDTKAQVPQVGLKQDVPVSDTLLGLTMNYIAAWESLNEENILRFHGDDIQYYWMGSGSITSNDAFARMLKAILPTMRSWSMKMKEPRVKVLGPNAAMVSFLFDFESLGVDGKHDSGTQAATYVFEKRNGDWKIILIHESAPIHERN